MFSLCIPTMDRFDKFLRNYIPIYLKNPLIYEIIITDENGHDVDKLNVEFPNTTKLKLIKNELRLGPLMNKLKACSFANCEWIALIDSDNFADNSYFEIASNYIKNNITDGKNIILSPCKAKPHFDFSYLSGLIYKKGKFTENRIYAENNKKEQHEKWTNLMNHGNYIINKNIIDNFDKNKIFHANKKYSYSCDVSYFNMILFENYDPHFHVVPNMEYEHVVHDGSIYLQTADEGRGFATRIIHKFINME